MAIPDANEINVVLVLQGILAIFSAFVSWWLRDLIAQFRMHCQSCDASQNTINAQVAELRVGIMYLRQSIEDIQHDVRTIRDERRHDPH